MAQHLSKFIPGLSDVSAPLRNPLEGKVVRHREEETGKQHPVLLGEQLSCTVSEGRETRPYIAPLNTKK